MVGGWRTYRVSLTFRAPLAFVYRWCTDYTPKDGRYSGEDRSLGLRRRIVRRSRRRVVFENVFDVGEGWGWERHVVSLSPPDRWRSVGKGNYQESVLDYRLTAMSPRRTKFTMRWRSRPTGSVARARVPRSAVEKYVAALWRRRARTLEREARRGTGVAAPGVAASSETRRRTATKVTEGAGSSR